MQHYFIKRRDSYQAQQEVSEMLANNLTLDDEEAVQEDLRQLEAEAVRLVIVRPFFSH